MDEFDVLYKSKLFRVLHELCIPAWRDIYALDVGVRED